MNTYSAKDLVWVPSETEVWVKAVVNSASFDTLNVTLPDGTTQDVSVWQSKSYDSDHDKDWENALKMGDLSEPALYSLLHRRSTMDNIYTFLGDVLISINPYKSINNLYEPIPKQSELDSRNIDAKSHLYVLADRAYNAIFDKSVRRQSQSILISGESGAGKTEAAKHIMAYLAHLSQNKRKELQASKGSANVAMLGAKSNVNIFKKKGGKGLRNKDAPGSKNPDQRTVTSLERIILQANPLIEAFGNSKTVRNDNSSRFGKFVELQYNPDGVIIAANTRHFLLEKSRIIRQGQGETNYHVFYMFLAAYKKEPSRDIFEDCLGQVDDSSSYIYLTDLYEDPVPLVSANPNLKSKDNGTAYAGIMDLIKKDGDNINKAPEKTQELTEVEEQCAAEFDLISEALMNVNVYEDEQKSVWRAMAAVLALGNLRFAEEDGGNSGCHIVEVNGNELARAAGLLGVDAKLLELSLCKRTVRAAKRASFQQVVLSAKEAEKSRDGLAKAIYEALFEWLVEKVNIATGYAIRNLANVGKKGSKNQVNHFIGILDIFGFEILETNSFEQLCINFANESLQNMFDMHIKVLEKADYDREQIPMRDIVFRDNKPLLSMLNKKGTGIFQLMDEQGQLLKRGSDKSLLVAIQSLHGKGQNEFYKGLKKGTDNVFIIQHFSGPVEYTVEGMVGKNADHLQPDLADLIADGGFPVEETPIQAPANSRMNKNGDKKKKSVFPSALRASSIIPKRSSKLAQDDGQFKFLQTILQMREEGGGSGSKVDQRQTIAGNGRAGTRGTRDNFAKKMAQLVSVSTRFRSQMKALERLLRATDQHYVRCIKPNDTKTAGDWNPHMVKSQIEMLGLIQMINIRRQGFPVRTPFENLLAKFSNLVQKNGVEWIKGENDRQACAELLNELYPGEKGNKFVMGETLCFMKEADFKEMERAERSLANEVVQDEEKTGEDENGENTKSEELTEEEEEARAKAKNDIRIPTFMLPTQVEAVKEV